MTPEAALGFVDTLNWRDRDVARLSGQNEVVVRPAIALFDSEINWNYTSKLARYLAERRGEAPPDFSKSDVCAEIERILMAGGQAKARAGGWGTWPWSTFDEDGAFVDWLRDLHIAR